MPRELTADALALFKVANAYAAWCIAKGWIAVAGAAEASIERVMPSLLRALSPLFLKPDLGERCRCVCDRKARPSPKIESGKDEDDDGEGESQRGRKRKGAGDQAATSEAPRLSR